MGRATKRAARESSAPGKTRTWWHPLLVQVLAFELSGSCDVRGEVSVGKMPLRLDVLISRRRKRLPTRAARDMPVLATLLNRVTLIQYKGPTDVLERGDLPQFEGVALLWFGQHVNPPPADEVTLLLIAPHLTDAMRKDCERLGYVVQQRRTGVHEVRAGAFATFVLEADQLSAEDPVLALFSTATLDPRQALIEKLEVSGHGNLLFFLLQQVQQLRQLGDVMKTQFKDLKEMDRFEAELLASIPVEKRLRGVPIEERLRGIDTEELVRALMDDRFPNLSSNEVARLKKRLADLESQAESGKKHKRRSAK